MKKVNKEWLLASQDHTLKADALVIDTSNNFIRKTMKEAVFLDIETSGTYAHVFGTGQQFVAATQLSGVTRILTVAGGSFYDLYHKGVDGVWGYGNHQRKGAFKKDPLDDRRVLEKVWHILDKARVIVAHNGSFDKGWLNGRFLMLGWKLPSPYALVCTYRRLHAYNMTSKKLEELSSNKCNTHKIATDRQLWIDCHAGIESAFEEMLQYNIGDIYDTMFHTYMSTAMYNPQKAIDLSNHLDTVATCRVDGSPLLRVEQPHIDSNTGLIYNRYVNPKYNIYYKDRCNIRSAKANLNYIKWAGL